MAVPQEHRTTACDASMSACHGSWQAVNQLRKGSREIKGVQEIPDWVSSKSRMDIIAAPN